MHNPKRHLHATAVAVAVTMAVSIALMTHQLHDVKHPKFCLAQGHPATMKFLALVLHLGATVDIREYLLIFPSKYPSEFDILQGALVNAYKLRSASNVGVVVVSWHNVVQITTKKKNHRLKRRKKTLSALRWVIHPFNVTWPLQFGKSGEIHHQIMKSSKS